MAKTAFFSKLSVDQLKKAKIEYEEQIQAIFRTKDATITLNESISNLIDNGIGKSIFTAEDTKDVVSFGDKIKEIQKEIEKRDKDTQDAKNKRRENDFNKEA